MRKRPDEPSEEEQKLSSRQPDGLVTQIREYQLLTPLYGGGATPGEIDPLTPIRGTEIRGHLRFWWRATRGGQFGDDMKKMLEREGEIWGRAAKKGEEIKERKKSEEGKNTQGNTLEEQGQVGQVAQEKREQEKGSTTLAVQIEVEQPAETKAILPYPVTRARRRDGQLNTFPDGSQKYQSNYDQSSRVPPYIAFPLQPSQDELKKLSQRREFERLSEPELQRTLFPFLRKVYTCANFKLKIIYPAQYREEIEAALWAWETFGGIGARTRRGFGALRLLKINDQVQNNFPPSNQKAVVQDWLQKQLATFVHPGPVWPKEVPHLEQHLAFMPACASQWVLQVWEKLIKEYNSFRQFRRQGIAGRSFWPEAETVREKTVRRHTIYTRLNHPEKFPRAAFGLPIIFHFKDEKDGDPSDTTLQGAKEENQRFASPLILRPLLCGNGSATGLAVVLKGSHLPPLALFRKNKTPIQTGPLQAGLSKTDLQNLPDLDVSRLNGQTNLLQAFLHYLEGK